MITTWALIETIRSANGETVTQTRRRIREAAVELELMEGCEGHEGTSGATMGSTVYCDGTCQPLPAQWHDDDADEIALAVKA